MRGSCSGTFKTGKGEYGEGDRFLGLRVGQIRQLAREYRDLSLDDISMLLASPWHEARTLAVILLAARYPRAGSREQTSIYRFYLRHRSRINNWDLVDISAAAVVGAHLARRSRAPLVRLARSRSLWDRRIAVIATFDFINRGEFTDALRLARLLMDDEHDLIHKAVGWMLREVGKRDRRVEARFLDRYGPRLPRTTLRYAIERFPPRLRQRYLALGR